MTLLAAKLWIEANKPALCITCGADGTPGGRQDMAVCGRKGEVMTLERVRATCDAAPPPRPNS